MTAVFCWASDASRQWLPPLAYNLTMSAYFFLVIKWKIFSKWRNNICNTLAEKCRKRERERLAYIQQIVQHVPDCSVLIRSANIMKFMEADNIALHKLSILSILRATMPRCDSSRANIFLHIFAKEFQVEWKFNVPSKHTHIRSLTRTSVFYVQLHILFDNCYTFRSHSLSREFNGFNRLACTLIHLLTSAPLSLSFRQKSFPEEKPEKVLQWHFVCVQRASKCMWRIIICVTTLLHFSSENKSFFYLFSGCIFACVCSVDAWCLTFALICFTMLYVYLEICVCVLIYFTLA